MDTVTLSKQNRLFWLGRYAERVYTTTQYMMKQYDRLIDGETVDYETFCQKMGIPCAYDSGDDFCRRYLFDSTSPYSVQSGVEAMLGNGMVLRETITSPTLAYLQMAHTAMDLAAHSEAPSLNALDTPILVVEMGIGMRVTRTYGDRLIIGILSLMAHLGMWSAPVMPVAPPIVSSDGYVSFVNASCPGIFFPSSSHTAHVEEGQELGVIADPLTGEVRDILKSPASGLLFTLREYPVVYEGSLIARILGGSL